MRQMPNKPNQPVGSRAGKSRGRRHSYFNKTIKNYHRHPHHLAPTRKGPHNYAH